MPVWSSITWLGDPADLAVAIEDLAELLHRPDWHADAACRDRPARWWFPEHGDTAENARPICSTCPVRQPCLEAGLADVNAQGVWGGTTVTERRRLRRTAATTTGAGRLARGPTGGGW